MATGSRKELIRRIALRREQERRLEEMKDSDAFRESDLVPHGCGNDIEDKEHSR